jgi:KipI family sensor histidine kinase inhibitor
VSKPIRSIPVGQIRLFGDAALIVGVVDARRASVLASTVEEVRWDGVTDVVVGLASLAVMVDPVVCDPAELIEPLQALIDETNSYKPVSLVTTHETLIEAVFDGPDLAHVAALTALSIEEVVHRFISSPFTVAMIGFAPGFAYLEGLDETLSQVPRRDSPRTSLPAGSLALAGGFAALYPLSSPGGWQIIGRSAVSIFNPRQAPYSLLKAGDRVRFVARASSGPPDDESGPPSIRPEGSNVNSCDMVIVEPGVLTTVQDAGRRGVAAIGVPKAGPADASSHELANALVGNPPNAPALEITASGPTIEFAVSTHIAVVGPSVPVTLDGRDVPSNRVVPVEAGQRLAVGRVHSGLRCYLAVSGGIEADRMMGSTATDALTGLGPGRLATGDVLSIGPNEGVLRDHLVTEVTTTHINDGVAVLRVVAGPHFEQFDATAMANLMAQVFTVSPSSDRVGLRLQNVASMEVPPLPTRPIESQAMVDGAIQVPPDGRPVILGCDHGTSGGYPVVAVVIAADLALLGQLGAGDHLRLRVVDHATARVELARHRRTMDHAVVGHYPTKAD